LTAELSVGWLPTHCSALGPVRLVCLAGFMSWFCG
jgi:hypothetical protein